jgi:hypothetical protein
MTVCGAAESQEAARISWGNEMRKKFSPAGACLEDGSIDQSFFKTNRIIIQLTEAKRWGDVEKACLLQGIEKHGVGKWREIITDHTALQRYVALVVCVWCV